MELEIRPTFHALHGYVRTLTSTNKHTHIHTSSDPHIQTRSPQMDALILPTPFFFFFILFSEGLLGIVIEVKLIVYPLQPVQLVLGYYPTKDLHTYLDTWINAKGGNVWMFVNPSSTFVETRQPVDDPNEPLSWEVVRRRRKRRKRRRSNNITSRRRSRSTCMRKSRRSISRFANIVIKLQSKARNSTSSSTLNKRVCNHLLQKNKQTNIKNRNSINTVLLLLVLA